MSIDAVLKIAGSGLNAQLVRMNTIASNLANATVVAGSPEDAYKAKRVVFSSLMLDPGQQGGFDKATRTGVYVTDVVDDSKPVKQIHEPGNSIANADGYVFGSNVNEIEEMVEMLDASRAYQNNVSVVSTAKDLMYRTLDLIKV
ncbi:flagellar basal body rod protein FlgC [Gammaproteobacteria bacterium]|jgi:flagellar basal-body rod protein FlgC|nr:flagellar basal body rod protein FlgC [Gammaproteobacteria bacterium]